MTSNTTERIAWQQTLFAPTIRRSDLAALPSPAWHREPRSVRVVRNHAIEPAAAVLHAAATYAGYELDMQYGGYSDALEIDDVVETDDAVVLWVDLDRYSPELVADLLQLRIAAIRNVTDVPIVAALSDAGARFAAMITALADLPGVAVVDVAAVCGDIDWWRPALADAVGTALSPKAAAILGRELGAVVIPAAFGTRIKAVMVDLDHTLHVGVLGEDGLTGVQVSAAAARLQARLIEARDAGIILAAVSKNDADDVDQLLATHPDYLLRPDDFFAVRANWSAKSASIAALADELRIGLDSILFIDDNPAEIAAAELALPAIHTMLVDLSADPDLALHNYPGVRQFTKDDAKALRTGDLQANAARDQLREVDEDEFFAALQIEMAVRVDDPELRTRATELFNKTNQFNLALARSSAASVERAVSDPSAAIVTCSVRDRLSDSGVISAMRVAVSGRDAVVDDLAISCRALGRRLESTIVFVGLQATGLLDAVDTVAFRCRAGDRNGPALDWLSHFVRSLDDHPASAQVFGAEEELVRIDAMIVRSFTPPAGLTLLLETT